MKMFQCQGAAKRQGLRQVKAGAMDKCFVQFLEKSYGVNNAKTLRKKKAACIIR